MFIWFIQDFDELIFLKIYLFSRICWKETKQIVRNETQYFKKVIICVSYKASYIELPTD